MTNLHLSAKLRLTIHSGAVICSIGSIVLPLALRAAEKPVVPKDFLLKVDFHCQPSGWSPWRVTIQGDGKVSQEVDYFEDGMLKTKNVTLTLARDKIGDLYATIIENTFVSLRREYKNSMGEDRDSVDLSVRANGKTHAVYVYAPGDDFTNNDIKKFNQIFSTIIELVPPPNKEQTPEFYRSPSTDGERGKDRHCVLDTSAAI